MRQDVGDQKLSTSVFLCQFLNRHQPLSTFVLDLIDDQFFESDLVPITGLQSQVVEVEVHLCRVVEVQIGLRLFDDFFKGKRCQLVRDRRLVDLVDRLFNRRVLEKSFAVWVVVVSQLDQAAKSQTATSFKPGFPTSATWVAAVFPVVAVLLITQRPFTPKVETFIARQFGVDHATDPPPLVFTASALRLNDAQAVFDDRGKLFLGAHCPTVVTLAAFIRVLLLAERVLHVGQEPTRSLLDVVHIAFKDVFTA